MIDWRSWFALALLLATPLQAQNWKLMDTGPCFSGSLTIKASGEVIPKAVAVKLTGNGTGGVVFDTDLLRIAAGWQGRFVDLSDREDFRFENRHRIDSSVDFGTSAKAGWTTTGTHTDPRGRKFGPLPRVLGRYRGLHLYGTRVTFQYEIAGTSIFDSPAAVSLGNTVGYTRTLQVGAANDELRLLLWDHRTLEVSEKQQGDQHPMIFQTSGSERVFAVLCDSAEGVSLEADGMAGVLCIKPRRETVRCRIVMGKVGESELEQLSSVSKSLPEMFDFELLSTGGPRRWTPPQTTVGRLGKDDGPYAVDTIDLPESNPWNALMYLSGHDFFEDGSAAICTGHGDVWIVEGLDDTLQSVTWTRFATGLLNPLGLRIVHGKVHVTCHDQLMRLHDLNDDGEADYYECVNNDAQVTGMHHRFATGLEVDYAGNFYYLRCTNEGRVPHGGTLLKVSANGNTLSVVATGLRNPNGMSISPEGTLTFADQQGGWVPSTPIHFVDRNANPPKFYGYVPSHHQAKPPTEFTQPMCWIPHRVDNSAGGQTWVPHERFGLPEGQLMHLSYGKCRLFVAFHEKLGDVTQGGVVPLPVAFDSGAMRARFHPSDGHLYVTGLRGWQTSAARNGCFQRVRHTGKPVAVPINLRATKQGLEITFNVELDEASASDPDNYNVETWNYRWSRNYGSPDFSVRNPKKQGRDEVYVDDAVLLEDRKTVRLVLEDLEPVMQMQIEYSIRSAKQDELKNSIYNTIHAIR